MVRLANLFERLVPLRGADAGVAEATPASVARVVDAMRSLVLG